MVDISSSGYGSRATSAYRQLRMYRLTLR